SCASDAPMAALGWVSNVDMFSNVYAFANAHHHKECASCDVKYWPKDHWLTEMKPKNPRNGRNNIAQKENVTPERVLSKVQRTACGTFGNFSRFLRPERNLARRPIAHETMSSSSTSLAPSR